MVSDQRLQPSQFRPCASTLTHKTCCTRDEVRFDVRLMQRVPYEGVSRMQTSLRRRHRDRVVRRGLALIIGKLTAQSHDHLHLCKPSLRFHHSHRFCPSLAQRATSTRRTPGVSTSPISLPRSATASRRPAVRAAPQTRAPCAHGTTTHLPTPAHADSRVRLDFDALYAYLTCGNYDFNYGNDGSRAPPPAPSALRPSRSRPRRAQTAARICAPSATSARP